MSAVDPADRIAYSARNQTDGVDELSIERKASEMELKFRRNPDYQDLRDEITPEKAFMDRRRLLAATGILGAGSILGALPACSEPQGALNAPANASTHPAPGAKLTARKTAFAVAEGPTIEDAFAGYCNFYEFGTDKSDPADKAFLMKTTPWQIAVEGETDAPGNYAVKDLVDFSKLEERVYRHRCVEAWSMVIPWVGVPMSSVSAKLKPRATAKYVQFETYLNRKEMPGTRLPVLDWPYVEGLRMDEAMNDLTLMAVGAYGKALQKQNGAPLRTVIPWKYGFKATKSVARIRFVASEPKTAWNKANANEYGFYSNVNPKVSHPRWSQASERVIGGKGGFNERRDTEMFNGYEKQVASLYAGMDLAKNY
ncbi:MAG TPA: protein-methionine-sulfoxide reductase catalytic subunit MsrP [Hyphomonadaceae bacterium]|nr:protein-methionine-sulfoxide reductase catalytic subunit MsrP [Hyphomonadaceae bacterium]